LADKVKVKDVINAYITGWRDNDRDGWLALFADEAVLTDPVGQPGMEGKEAIAQFWDRVHDMAESFDPQVQRIVGCGTEGLLLFTMVTKMGSGGMAIDVADIIEINDAGKIVSLRAFWDNDCMRVL